MKTKSTGLSKVESGKKTSNWTPAGRGNCRTRHVPGAASSRSWCSSRIQLKQWDTYKPQSCENPATKGGKAKEPFSVLLRAKMVPLLRGVWPVGKKSKASAI